jgi:hypothetical protein
MRRRCRVALSFSGTNADPASQALGAAELTHVGTDLDQEHGRTHLIDPRDGLQQDQQRLPGRQALGSWTSKRFICASRVSI